MFGIQVINQQDSVQVDGEYPAFRLVQKGTLPFRGIPPTPMEDQILLVAPVGGIGTVRPALEGQGYSPTSANGIDYALVQLSSTVAPSSDKFGFRVHSSSGAVVYDSGSPVMVPQGNAVHAPRSGNSLGNPTKLSLPNPPAPGRTRYIDWTFATRPYGYIRPNPQSNYGFTVVAAAHFQSDGVSLELVTVQGGPPVNEPPVAPSIHFLVADI